MFRSITAISLTLSIFSSGSFAGYWVSANVPDNESPHFDSPSEACSWYIGSKLPGFSFTHVSSGDKGFNLPKGSLFCFGVRDDSPAYAWNIGNAGYIGDLQDVQDESFYNNDTAIPEEVKDAIRRTMQRFYGDQVNQWNINAKMLKVFAKWISTVSEKSEAFNFVPRPIGLPIISAGALVNYFLRYGQRIVTASGEQASYAVMVTAALAMKTEFGEAGNL